MNTIYLLLGSNMGNSFSQLKKAREKIQALIGPIVRLSDLYTTSAWGNTKQPDFLNQVIRVESTLTAMQTMQCILDIEKKQGRIRTVKNAPRIIDIDILFFNKLIIDTPQLSIPHPQIQNRRFVLVHLNQLSPNLKHPVLKKSVHQLLVQCTDHLDVKKF